MKKIYFLTLALICATIANAAGVINIYAKKTDVTSSLNLYAWTSNGELLGNWSGKAFTETVNVNGTDFWKMSVDTGSNTSWNLIFNNSNGQTVDMKGPSSDTYYEVTKGGSKGLVATAITDLNPNATGIYLYGNEINAWSLDASYEFQKTDTENVYTLENVTICGFFKIGNKDWSTINIGADGENKIININEATTLINSGESKNLYTDGTYFVTVILDMTGSAPVVTFSGSKTNSGVYLKGEMTGWGDNNDYQFTSLGAGIYELSKMIPASEGQFKITANGNWYGLPGDSEPMTINYGTTTLGDGKNMILPTNTVAEKFTLTIGEDSSVSLEITECTTDIEGIFLRGNVNNWEVDEAWKFTETSENVYELKDVKLQGYFKIADAIWKDVNVGSSDGTKLKIGQANYAVNGGDSKNFSLDGTYQCSSIKLDMTGNTPVVTITGEATTSGIFVSSDVNQWCSGDNTAEWELADNGAGYYTIEKNLQDSDFNIVINNKIYGIEGTETVTIDYDESYILVENAQKIALQEETAAGAFEVTISDSGEVLLIVSEGEYSGVADITINENKSVEYFTVQGVKVENPNNGIFIKRQGNKVSKVIL